MKPTEEQTAEQRVKAIYPDAEMYIHVTGAGDFAVGSPSVGKTIGDGKMTRAEAWSNAASRLPPAPIAAPEKVVWRKGDRMYEYDGQNVTQVVPTAAPKRCHACNGTQEECMDNEYCRRTTWPSVAPIAAGTEPKENVKICHYHNGPFQDECPLGGKCELLKDWGKVAAGTGTEPVCKYCDLPIRETHQGRIRNEWEHLDGFSFCVDGQHWAWPKDPTPSVQQETKCPTCRDKKFVYRDSGVDMVGYETIPCPTCGVTK